LNEGRGRKEGEKRKGRGGEGREEKRMPSVT
jgi:hypothetical protein